MNENELMKAATEEVAYSNVYWGKALLTLWEGKFPRNDEGKIIGKPVRWVEGDNPKERIIMIDCLLDLCPGCTANYQIKAGFCEGKELNVDEVKELAKTPSFEALIAKMLGSLQSSLYNLAYVLQAIVDKDGSAAPAEEAAPAAE